MTLETSTPMEWRRARRPAKTARGLANPRAETRVGSMGEEEEEEEEEEEA